MATDLRSLPAYLADTATFRTWVQGIHDALVACGLVNTSDTGQIDFTTVNRPGGTNGNAGYKIYSFDDALQATNPVFIKLTFAVGGALDIPMIRAQVGTGTNGSGTLTGQVGNEYNMVRTTSKTAGATLPTYTSGGAGRIAMVTNLDSGSSNFSSELMVERTRDASGAATADGIVTYFGSTPQFQVFPFSGSVPAHATAAPWGAVSGHHTKAGTDVTLFPMPVGANGKACSATSLLSYLHADIGELASITASVLGTTRTYMPMGDGVASAFAASGGAASVALLWE